MRTKSTMLIQEDKHEKPPGWKMSARAVHTYICGGKAGKREITPKYIGHQRLVEIAISTLVTDRALLLIGEPGTAKSWLSEHLAAAINGDSTKVVQGTAGTTEEQIRYTWNYAMLIARAQPGGADQKPDLPRDGVRHPGPLRGNHALRLRGAGRDDFAVVGETHLGAGVDHRVAAQKGFSVIATANTRDRGVNDMSAALKRRFNIVVLPTPKTLEIEIEIVRKRVTRAGHQPVARREGARRRSDRKGRHDLPRAAPGPNARRQEQTQDSLRRALDGGGDLGAGQQHGPRRQLRLGRGDSRPTWPPGCKARLSRTRKKTAPSGKSI